MTLFRTIAAILFFALAGAGIASAQSREPVAGSVVQSREWTVHRGANESEEFSGDVRYDSGPNSLRADWARYVHKTKFWTLKGHVRIARALASSGGVATARGDEAFYDGISRAGRLIGRAGVFLTRQPADDSPPDEAQARELDWSGENKALLSGEVHAFGPRLETWSDDARLLAQPREVLLTGGRPVARKIFGPWTGAVKADRIEAFDSPRRLIADGRVQGWIVLPKKDEALKTR